jgi:hypothetical protein
VRYILFWRFLLQKFGHDTTIQCPEAHETTARLKRLDSLYDRVASGIFLVSLVVSISAWFLPIRAPLWEDETGSFWMINKGFAGILPSQNSLSFPAYSYILWFSTKIIGTSEISLRIPSIAAMLGAVYMLYLAAREIFGRDIAIIAAVIFCINPIVIFASIDIRPYAFAVLATNAAIYVVVRLRRDDRLWVSALFGLLASLAVYFHYLSVVILPALVICFFAVRIRSRRTIWRPFLSAFVTFGVSFLPLIPGLVHMFQTKGTHVYEDAPNLLDLAWTLVPGWTLPVVGGFGLATLLVASRPGPTRSSISHVQRWRTLICVSLALIPVLILYGVSAWTTIHLFASHHRIVAVPGIALSWACVVAGFRNRVARLLLCVMLVAITCFSYFTSPSSHSHKPSWKYALAFIEQNASVDNAPVLMCSGFVESNYATMPIDSAKENSLFAWLSYYRLTVPVVPLPKSLNEEAIRVGSNFLRDASRKHQRFLAAAHSPSIGTLEWLAHSASAAYTVHKIGDFDGVEVIEFTSRISETSK